MESLSYEDTLILLLKTILSLGGSSPLCAVTSITNDIRYTSQKQQNLLLSTRSSE